MFGYVIANPKELSEEEKRTYRAAYCGVCHALRERNGITGRFTLAYESAFLALVLMSVYDCEPEIRASRCFVHPAKPHDAMYGELIGYAADMNLLLTYFKLLDDRDDDHNLAAGAASRLFSARTDEIRAKYPKQAGVIEASLDALRDLENTDEMNPDLPANCFGRLMGAVFTPYEDNHAEALFSFGAALGRFLYILDAADDLKSDLRRKRYNPLTMSDPRMFNDILMQMMNDVVSRAEALNIGRYRQIIENVLYSGVWMKYKRGNSSDPRSV